MALFGSSKKSTMENLTQQLATHPMLQWVAQVLRQEKQEGVLHGKVQQMFPTAEEEKNGWKMPAHDGFRYTVYGYEPLSGCCGIGYRDVMKAWIEVVRALMMKMYPNYQYSDCSICDLKTSAAANELHFDESVMCYFTYTLPRPHYERWFKEQQ